jgi:hypothetical protein
MGIFQKVPLPLFPGLQSAGQFCPEDVEPEIFRQQCVGGDIVRLGQSGDVTRQAFD